MNLRSEHGFTFIELMVVVAIIGVISALALPSYQIHQARSRQKEATIALGALYTSQRIFHAETGSFTACIKQTGYSPDVSTSGSNATAGGRFYFLGFNYSTAILNICGDGFKSCRYYAWNATGGDPDAICVPGVPTFGGASSESDTAYGANAKAFNAANLTELTTLAASGCLVKKDEFRAGAAGSISSRSGTIDIWRISQTKELTNVQIGTF